MSTRANQQARKPVHRIYRGKVEVAIWERSGQEGRFFEASFSRPRWPQDGSHAAAESFGLGQLADPALAAADAPEAQKNQPRVAGDDALRANTAPLLDGIEPPRRCRMRRIRVYAVRERSTSERPQLSSPRDVWELLLSDVASWDRERFLTLALDSAHRLIGMETVSTGTLNATAVHPREIFKGLILANAAAFIAVHNHPSGQVQPSPEDRAVTKQLGEAGELLGIRLLDHVVVRADGFFSFADGGQLPRFALGR